LDIKEENILGNAADGHWYYRAKSRALEAMLPTRFNRRVMDIGAGSGFFSRHLAKRGLIDEALCIDPGYERDRDERVGGAMIRYRRAPEPMDAGIALFMDVLEHVPDDAGLLSAYRPYLPPDARVIITVPAFRFLWSGHDVFLEHHRRYTRRMLIDTIARADFRLVESFYYYGLVLPVAAASRLLSPNRMEEKSAVRPHGAVTNAILYAASAAERPLMRFNKLAGLTVCGICKPG
jgi:SAM-dependent methyltransferase